MTPENALVSRRIVFERDNVVTLVEVWDTQHPDSPYIAFDRASFVRVGPENPHVRAFKMTREQFEAVKPPLKGESYTYTDEDMQAVGRAFMDTIEQARMSDAWVKGWAPVQCPSEIIFDLLNRAPAAPPEDWRDDPSADERWNAGLDFAMKQFCYALGVDPQSVRWDAATETLDGDVNAVIWNILRAKMGDEWDPDKAKAEVKKWHRVAMEAGAVTCTNGSHVYPLRDSVKHLEAEVARLKGEVVRLHGALIGARDYLRNDFEPDNQSRAWHRADKAIRATVLDDA